MQLFYSTLVKADGQPYEPTSLRTMLAGLDRFSFKTTERHSADPDTDCTIYIEWIEGITKTQKVQKGKHALKHRMFATGGPCCPVGIMEAMIAKRPDEL